MCNAWNHSAGCSCGWGGEGHLGGGGGGGWNARTTWGGGSDLDSPNAYCPVCDAAVYFIRPSNGGSLWLDEMGPPWPKHGCMNSASERRRFAEPLAAPLVRVPGTAPAAWPMRFSGILSAYSAARRAWMVRIDREIVNLSVAPPEPLSPVYIRRDEVQAGLVELEYLGLVDEQPVPVSLRGYTSTRPGLGSRSRELSDASWSLLRSWFIEADLIEPERLDEFLTALRERTEWMLDPGWVGRRSGPPLVKGSIERLRRDYPGVDVDAVYSAMAMLLV